MDFERLTAAYLADDGARGQERLAREFVAEFRGFSGSANQKNVLDETGFARLPFGALTNGEDIDHATAARLRARMQAHSKPVAGKHLGLIGEAHLEAHCAELGARWSPSPAYSAEGDRRFRRPVGATASSG